MMFMKTILPITQDDYLEPYWTDFIIKILQIDVDAQELQSFGRKQDDVTDQILALGYENQLSILNFGSISFYILVYLTKVVIFLVIVRPLKFRYPSKYNSM